MGVSFHVPKSVLDQFHAGLKLSCPPEVAEKVFRHGWKMAAQGGDPYNAVMPVGAAEGVSKPDCDSILKHLVAAFSPADDPGILSAADLYDEDIAPPKWIVEGLLPQGLAIIAGKPKTGKSWMALDLALRVSSGGLLFDEAQCANNGDVLYLALEDTKIRLQTRIKKLMPNGKPSPSLRVLLRSANDDPTQWLPRISAWLKSHPDARLVVVDTFQMIRQPSKYGTPMYETDYKAVGELKALADQHGVAIVLIHHLRKSKSDDPFDQISGSTGLTGAADTMFVLERQVGGNATLHVTGRDIGAEDYGLLFDPKAARWKLVDGVELPTSSLQADIVASLNGTPMTPTEIAVASGKTPQAVNDALPGLLKKCLVMKVGYGKYVSGAHHHDQSL